jgi:hypothetical protein
MLHSGQKPYKCDLCHKEFSQKGNMNKHMMGMHFQKDEQVKAMEEKEKTSE